MLYKQHNIRQIYTSAHQISLNWYTGIPPWMLDIFPGMTASQWPATTFQPPALEKSLAGQKCAVKQADLQRTVQDSTNIFFQYLKTRNQWHSNARKTIYLTFSGTLYWKTIMALLVHNRQFYHQGGPEMMCQFISHTPLLYLCNKSIWHYWSLVVCLDFFYYKRSKHEIDLPIEDFQKLHHYSRPQLLSWTGRVVGLQE